MHFAASLSLPLPVSFCLFVCLASNEAEYSYFRGRHGNPLQYSCLENPMDRGARCATVHGAAKSQTRLKRLGTQTGIVIFKHALLIETKPAMRLFSPFTSPAENIFYSDACMFFPCHPSLPPCLKNTVSGNEAI